MSLDEALLERVRRVFAARGEAVEKRMVGGRSFLVGGRLCCGVNRDGLVVRLGADGVRRAREEPHVRQLQLGGTPVEAFAVVAPAGVADDAALTAWIERGIAAASS
jgi:TfoX N-terminal domain